MNELLVRTVTGMLLIAVAFAVILALRGRFLR